MSEVPLEVVQHSSCALALERFIMLAQLLATFVAAALARPSTYADSPRVIAFDESDLDPVADGRDLAPTAFARGTPTLQRRGYNATRVSGNGLPVGPKSCPGAPIEPPIPFASDRATVNIYYSSEDNGTNCAYVENKTGESQFMYVKIFSASDPESYSWDLGYEYARFAGSVSVKNMSGDCLGLVANFDGRWWYSPQNFHCGA